MQNRNMPHNNKDLIAYAAGLFDGEGNVNYHRYIVWNDDGVLNILPKFPIVEHINFKEEEKLEKLLEDPFNWCAFYHFKDEVKFKLLNMGREQDFTMFDGTYLKLIIKGIDKSLECSNKWKGLVNVK
jgi:hypothetical protein